jgi:putative PIN family toxin of toxin-antitoxin system
MHPAPGAEQLKAVLDTNLYIAAFQYPKGRNAVLWRAALAGRYRLLVSPAIIRETAKVLRADFGWEDDRVQKVVRGIAAVAAADLVAPRTVLSVIAADPDDNRILECAVDGKADLIVSNDHHLLNLRAHADIPIVAGVDFRRTLGLK